MEPRIASKLAIVVATLGASAHAHHSYTEFDNTQTVEVEGTLIVLAWQNPHTHIEVRVLDSDNHPVVWNIETAAVNGMRRRGAPLDAFKVGEVVTIAGWPSKRSASRMFATNLLGSGTEIVTQGTTRRWPEAATTPQTSTSSLAVPLSAPTLFRVWSSDPASDPRTRTGFLTRTEVSLTEAAKRAVVAFDPVSQSTTDGCTPKGMPLLMGQPFPMEFVDEGDTILVRIEEYDAVRTIHMSNSARPASANGSLLGHSVGRWEGKTLVVETDRLDSPYFNSNGVPLSKSARTFEQFTVSDDGRVLTYALTVTDPETFTEPAQATRVWLARDGERVLPFNCKMPGQR